MKRLAQSFAGGNEPVADDGVNNHSVVANALLRGLQRMESAEFTAAELFSNYILEPVAGRAAQTPEYGWIANSGHDSGDFVFCRRGAIANATTTPRTSTQPTRQEHVEPQVYTETINGVAIEMVRLPAGRFLMGSPESEVSRSEDEGPQHEVTISRPFDMGKYEVTQAQWRAVARLPKVKMDLNAEPSHFKGDNLPVESVSWEDAVEFCERLTRATGREYRLPSEAEWEYACRAKTTTPFAFGETITPEIVNYDGNYPYGAASKGVYRKKTIAVGSLGVANGFGLFDMHGNVWEWCQDNWHENYNGAPGDGSVWRGGDARFRVLRGGSWDFSSYDCRAANRDKVAPGSSDINCIGFRVVAVARTR